MKAMKTMVKCVAVAAFATAALAVHATQTDILVAQRANRWDPVTPGVWHADLEEARSYAEANGLPLIAVWSNGDFCQHCLVWEGAANSPVFVNWMKTSGIVFYFGYVGDGYLNAAGDFGAGPSDDWQEGYHGYSFYWCCDYQNATMAWPYVRFYWPSGGVDLVYTGSFVDGEYVVKGGAPCMVRDDLVNASPSMYAPWVSLGDYGTYNPNGRYMLDFITNRVTGVLRDWDSLPSWTVTFDANEGSVDEQSRMVVEGEAVGNLPTATRDGYRFDGWFTDENGGTRVTADTPVMDDVIYYAHWTQYSGSIVVRSFEPATAGSQARLVLGREGDGNGRIAVKVKTQTSTGICGTDFDYVKEVLEWEDGDLEDKEIKIQTYASGAGKSLRVKLATLATGTYEGNVTPRLIQAKVYAEMLAFNPGKVVVTGPEPLAVTAGETLRMTFSRVGGSDGSIAVKAKTQTSTAIMGVNGSADFDYVKKTLEWGDGDMSDKVIEIPTYAGPWEGVKQLRVKLATLATGAYAGNLVPTLDQTKIYVDIESQAAFGTVYVEPEVQQPVAGQTLRLLFRRVGGRDYPIAVKYKVQTSTAIAGEDFEYKKGVIEWKDGEDGDQVVEVPTYPSAAGKQLRVKLSTLTQGDYTGCVTPHLNSAKVYVPLY